MAPLRMNMSEAFAVQFGQFHMNQQDSQRKELGTVWVMRLYLEANRN